MAQNNSIPPLPLSNKISSLAFPLAINGLIGEAREGRRTWATTVWSSMQHARVMHLDFWKSQFHFTKFEVCERNNCRKLNRLWHGRPNGGGSWPPVFPPLVSDIFYLHFKYIDSNARTETIILKLETSG